MSFYPQEYDLIVVGAGHAGCEGALAAARMGLSVLLFNLNLDTMALMACNPAVGGLAKGHLVKEIDALGGVMGHLADATGLQFRTLNLSKGPAVRGTRIQCDKQAYRLAMKSLLEKESRLHLREAMVERLLVEDGRVVGVVETLGLTYRARAVLITTGTFLNGLIHIGECRIPAGRAGEFAATGLAACLLDLGFRMGRFKTGTPPRLAAGSIDFAGMDVLSGDPRPRPFSWRTQALPQEQLNCFITHTTGATHAIIRDHIHLSPLYSGVIKGVSARYCPSLEDKVMRFTDKDRHPVTLEFEGLDTEEVYAKGLGNCLPLDLQEKIVRSVPGLEQAEIMRSAYAIEYDFVQPTQLKPTLETKLIRGLFLAGQINGTSGYEEAAAQGLWSGINAALQVQGCEPFTLERSQAYMGVMIDDLITRGVDEPYRMFTSRAEYRLILREDNAAFRLMEKGHELGLIPDDDYRGMKARTHEIQQGVRRLSSVTVNPTVEVNRILSGMGSLPTRKPMTLFQLLKRPEVYYDSLKVFEGWQPIADDEVKRQIEIEAKYEDYIRRQHESIEKFRELEHKKIPPDIDYQAIPSLSNELKYKLSKIQPASIGQARRISGMTQAALAAILIFLKKMELESEAG